MITDQLSNRHHPFVRRLAEQFPLPILGKAVEPIVIAAEHPEVSSLLCGWEFRDPTVQFANRRLFVRRQLQIKLAQILEKLGALYRRQLSNPRPVHVGVGYRRHQDQGESRNAHHPPGSNRVTLLVEDHRVESMTGISWGINGDQSELGRVRDESQ